ncbi:MAG: MFS transporter [Acetobacterales bacterium]
MPEPSPGAPPLPVSGARLVALVCVAQVLAQIGAYAWPALLPGRVAEWGLSNSAAGWITSAFYLSYTLSVPVLVTLTDRIDAKKVYLFGVALTVTGHLLFALAADGFAGALAARLIAGVGWAGTYMTGLKLLADRVDGRLMSRAVAGHAASIGIAGAVSFLFADTVAGLLGWRAAFLIAAASAAGGWAIALLFAPWQEKRAPQENPPGLFDFGPVFRNRAAMAYSVAYCVHTWEMNALRGWGVAFLAWVAAHHGATPWLAPAAVLTATALLGVGASVAGNEAAIRLGRVRLVRLAMALSILFGAAIGFTGGLSYSLAAALLVCWGIVIWLDSASLTAGAAGNADPARRGATLAIHSMLGYGGGFVGPLAVGYALDAAGGMSTAGWAIAFGSVAAVMLAGRVAFALLRPRDLSGERHGG